MTDVPDSADGPALADDQDDLIEETPTAYPDDVPADHEVDPTYVPEAEFDEGLEVDG